MSDNSHANLVKTLCLHLMISCNGIVSINKYSSTRLPNLSTRYGWFAFNPKLNSFSKTAYSFKTGLFTLTLGLN